MKRILYQTALSITLMFGATTLSAQIVLDFEGLKDIENINGFYDGGTGSLGSSGTDYGISFAGSGALSIIDGDVGGSGNFANEPSPSTIMFFTSGTAIMNVWSGFDTGFSFFYSAYQYSGFIKVYDDYFGTGNMLTSLYLPSTGPGVGDPTGYAYGVWAAIGVEFFGTAKSVNFAGTANQIGFDNITLGSNVPVNPVPEPSEIGMIALPLGLGLILFLRRKRRK